MKPFTQLSVPVLIPLFVMSMTALCHPVQAKGTTYTRTVNRQISVSPDALVVLDNQFGSIVCQNWDSALVSIEVVISVEESSGDKGNDLLRKIDINIRESSEQVTVKTLFAAGFSSRKPFHVDYLVKMPASVNLNVTNAFGDVDLQDRKGRTTLKLEHGHAVIEKLLHGDNLLEVAFGSMKVQHIKGAVLIAEFSRLQITYAGSIRLKSSYSDLSVDNLILLSGSMEGGTCDIRTIDVIELKTTYANILIGTLKQKASMQSEFGNVEVRTVDPHFISIFIDDHYGNHTFPLSASAGFMIDAESSYGRIILPDKKTHFSAFQESGHNAKYTGWVGEETTSKVTIRSSFGNINLK